MKKLIVIVLVAILLSGCVASEAATEPRIVSQESVDFYAINVYVDPETGVNYLINTRYTCGGISVRYNADGTIYVSDVTDTE